MTFQSGTFSSAKAESPARSWADPALLFAAIFMALIAAGDRMLTDPDTHWHVKVGADIWLNKAAPWTDVYSHTFAGAPWIAKEWLSQLLMYGVSALAGATGLVIASALALAATFAAMFAWLTTRVRSAVALALTLLALVLLTPHILARPHVFALLPLLLWTRGLVEALEENRLPRLWLLGVLVVWANLHGSFTVAYPIAGVLSLEAIFAAPAGRKVATTLRWAAFGLAAVLAGCVTPYGYHALAITFTLAGGESLSFINEWAPIGWTPVGVIAGASALLAVAALLAGGLRNAVRVLLVAALAAMMIKHVRFLDVYALVVPVVVAAPLAQLFPRLASATEDRDGKWPALMRASFAGAAVASVALMSFAKPQQDPRVTPVAALQAARAAGVSGPVYNNYSYGGFLIAQGVPTFIDGRSDQLFLGGFMTPLVNAINAREHAPFIDFIEKRGATWAIVPTDSKEAAHFAATASWPRLYSDDVASVFVKR